MDNVKLSREEVDEQLCTGENVHTFVSGGFALLGCDVKRVELLNDVEKYGAELAGEQAIKMKHGIVIMKDPPVFCETKQA